MPVAPAVAVADPAVQKKYIEERDKRLRADGPKQFVRLSGSQNFEYLAEDPWVDHAALNSRTPALDDTSDVKFLVLGAGFCGLLFAVRLMQAGFSASDIRLVDDAGGFGGTWYWNRYPGLMCDVESYIYMPLLEETGYMPRRKYAHGSELREHAERIAEKWGLTDKVLFRTRYKRATWDEEARRWVMDLVETRGKGPDADLHTLRVRAQFVFMASGTLNSPHMPRLAGLEEFEGACFHTSRWDFGVTGGSPTDWDMPLLANKRVGIIGTGATAVQAVPELARCAKQLYVFQRTPASVDVRGQRDTDPEEWRTKIAAEKGWQRVRAMNFNAITTRAVDRPEEDLVADAWCHMPSFVAYVGGESTSAGPGSVIPEPKALERHIAALHAADLERSERVRARTEKEVKDPQVAEALKAWYPVWCKRPTFHDDYLPAFNRPNVRLVDTNGLGVERMTKAGVVANGVEYPVDILVLSTGFVASGAGSGSPASRASVEIRGRGGRSMDDKWTEDGAATLHGVATNGFPNFFWPGPNQGGAAVNFIFSLDTFASHVAGVLKEAVQRAGGWSDRLLVEVNGDAEQAWAKEVLMRASWFAVLSGCTPGYLNNQGDSDRADPARRKLRARNAIWDEGIGSYVKVLEKWRADGQLQGYEISRG